MTRGVKPLKPGRTERQVIEQVLDAARMLGLDLGRQNTGAGVNPAGQTVRFGTPGNADLSGMLPDGRKLDVEVKREHFQPSKLAGAKREQHKADGEKRKPPSCPHRDRPSGQRDPANRYPMPGSVFR